MAITTLSGLRDALPGQTRNFTKANITSSSGFYISLWDAVGEPAAGSLSIGNTTTGLIPTDATAGAFSFANPSSGNSYLGKVTVSCQNVGTLILYDRLHHSGSYTSANGNINTTDMTAIDRYSTGEGAEIWVEIATALSALATTLTVQYTDQAGSTSATATCVVPASAAARRMFPFTAVIGTLGVRSIENLSGSAAPTGTFNLVILRRLAEIPMSVSGQQVTFDWSDIGISRIYNDACIAMMMQTASGGSGILAGSISIAQG
jgi:hypothetical protein